MHALGMVILLSGCFLLEQDKDGEDTGGTTGPVDEDRDGYPSDEDCDDTNPLVRPNAREICDGLDNDCDALIDDGDDSLDPAGLITVYADADGDGAGDPAAPVEVCAAGPGQSATATDCDDTNPAVLPGAQEVCDGLDNDCNTLVDTDDPGMSTDSLQTYYRDDDGDGFGDDRFTLLGCGVVAGYALDGGDCDDDDRDFNPAATEVCDGLDNDCDDEVDDDDPSRDPATGSTWYPDEDGDGLGNGVKAVLACEAPRRHVDVDGDCDDTSDRRAPGLTEVCDGVDNDCDELADEADDDLDLSSLGRFYADNDSDGFGAGAPVLACNPPPGHLPVAGDCDDANPGRSPSVREVCNDIDDDCDGLVDGSDPSADPTTLRDWYADGDEDGFGDPEAPFRACSRPAGHVANDQDCDDQLAEVNPDGDEVCGGADEDCDGLVDDADDSVDPADFITFYRDTDGDDFGDGGATTRACAVPAGYAAVAGDCALSDPTRFPGAVEICNGLDDNCDSRIDDDDPLLSPSFDSLFYPDADGDGFGDSTRPVLQCGAPPGYVAIPGDCNDADPDISLDGVEVCDGVDNDCDRLIDDADTSLDLSTRSRWYRDVDGDTYGALASAFDACSPGPDGVTIAGDCNDTNAAVSPGLPELCDGFDNDCDLFVDDLDRGMNPLDKPLWWQDDDGDGTGVDGTEVRSCREPVGFGPAGGDCDDDDPSRFPGNPEICNEQDDDCDDLVDGDDSDWVAVGARFYYPDEDGDGYGSPSSLTFSCGQPDGFASTFDDCNDEDSAINPGAREVCDGDDEDCDGLVDDADPTVDLSTGASWFRDRDADGFGNSGDAVVACAAPDGRVARGGDCNDGNRLVNPNAREACDGGLDNNCNGLADNADPTLDPSLATGYAPDGDADGFRADAPTVFACSPPAGFGLPGADCNDGDRLINPGATEVCSGADEDCDDLVDDLDPSLDLSSVPVWYVDGDGDGAPGSLGQTCVLDPAGGPVAEDCDDLDRTVYPGAPELCDLRPNDCDDLSWISDGETAHWVPAEGPVVDLRPLVRLGATLELEGSGRLGICTNLNGQIHFTGGTVEVLSDGATLQAASGSALRFVDVERASVTDLSIGGADAARGATIDFDAPGATLELDRVSSYFGSVSADGGAIWFNGAELLLSETWIEAAQADGDGGLIYLASGHLEAVDSNFASGSANRGGALFLTPGTSADLVRTGLSNNLASDDGGAIYADQASVDLSDVDTEANGANRGGVLFADRGSLSATGGSWFGNDALAGGSAVFSVGQATELTGITVRAHDSGALGAFTFQPLGRVARVNACVFPADRPNLPFDLAVLPDFVYDLVGEATLTCDDAGCR